MVESDYREHMTVLRFLGHHLFHYSVNLST